MLTYHQLAYLHLAIVLPAFVLGTILMIGGKGTRWHRRLGAVYLLLMLLTGVLTLFMPATVGPRLLNHFGYLHSLSLLTLVTVPTAYWAARHHRVMLHSCNMIGLYVGGLMIAGGFALMPGRLLHGWLFGG
ncbi:MAG: DUF2306 domain-containing protein [Salinisphaeraceae bacterium]